nr:TetR family transcriptional regulator [Paracidovorax valerianellae]
MGWEGLATNAIAERAGVNIGSLYCWVTRTSCLNGLPC